MFCSQPPMATTKSARTLGVSGKAWPALRVGASFRSRRHLTTIRGTEGGVPVVPAASSWDAPDVRALDRQLADVQQQLDRQMDGMFSFGDIRRFDKQMDIIDQQMDRQMRAMEQQMDKTVREMDREMQSSMKKLAEQQPEVKIQRQEQRSPSTYKYYESIQIQSGSSMAAIVPARTTAAPPFFNPLLLVALIISGAYAAVTAAFAKNFDLTTYQQQRKWQLLLLWPILAIASPEFRRQLVSALKGEKVTVTRNKANQQPQE